MSTTRAEFEGRWSRRGFLIAAGAGATAALLPGTGRGSGADRVLVALFLRGAADALNLCVPQADPDYYALRPTLQVPAGQALDLDGFFGLEPTLSPLLPIFRSGDLALVHAVGSTDPTRSHFDAQGYMERAVPGDKSVTDGWLNRYLAATADRRPIAGMSLGGGSDGTLAGPAPALAFATLAGFQLDGKYIAPRGGALRERYAALGGALGRSMDQAFEALAEIDRARSASAVAYPTSALGAALRDAAALVQADVGVRVVTVNAGGWDTHSYQTGRLVYLIDDLARALAAFHADLGAHRGRTLLLAMTEFGRSAAQNAAGGTEHGHGGLMLALGGGVAGGRVLLRGGIWPGLDAARLYEGRDLKVTTDFRDVFAEVLDRHLGVRDPRPILPGHAAHPSRYPGLFA